MEITPENDDMDLWDICWMLKSSEQISGPY